ncbi:MAG TPA: gamma-glutamyltransferase [bacterium]
MKIENIEVLDAELIERGEKELRNVQRYAVSKKGMVSTQHYRATEAGVEMLEQGGNAVDAAVAAAFALGVCEPASSGLGGQTMMLLHLEEKRQKIALDGSSRAPNRVRTEKLVKKRQRQRGYSATTVPSTPAVLDYVLKTYGTMPLSEVLKPAIRLAEDGFVVSELFHLLSKREHKRLRRYNSGDVFLTPGRQPYKPLSVLNQPALANTLKILAKKGTHDFYLGSIAAKIDEDMEKNGGYLRRDDLAHIPDPVERKPLSGKFKSMRIMTMPPPGAGRTLIEILNILENFTEKELNLEKKRGLLRLIEATRQSQIDRKDRPYDPSLYSQVEEKLMIRMEYAENVAKRIRKSMKKKPELHGDTTHLSVMDKFGNAVALTQSIEKVFGSFAMTPELGFLYNNYLDAYEFMDISHPYYLRPNGVPWASVAPTIIYRGKNPYIAIGSPGSLRIAPAIAQVLLRLMYTSPFEAIEAPRVHCTYNGKVSLEASRMRSDIPGYLEKRGFTIDRRDAYSFYLGCVQMVLREKNKFIGVADPRRDGSAGGP